MTAPDWQAWKASADLDEYEARWERLEAAGEHVHGEADFVSSFRPASVLDGGCGMGRVGIELARRGALVVGVDLDVDLLERARAKAPELEWVEADLATVELERRFDLVVLAGNVVPYAETGTRAGLVAGCARHLGPGGTLVAGFSLHRGWPTVGDYDRWCDRVGLGLVERWGSWDRGPFTEVSDYAVSVHRSRRGVR